MSMWKSRTTAVVAGAAVVVSLGATGATAARMITGADIRNNTVTGADIQNHSLTGADIKNGSVGSADIANNDLTGVDIRNGSLGLRDLSAAAKDALNPEVLTATLGAPVTIASIGGPINANNTNLETGFNLPAGTYLITVSGSFLSSTDAATDVDVYPQLSLWLDKSGDGAFQWQDDEGDISPNALMPTVKDRHISVSGQSVVTLDEATDVGLLAFGYAADQSSSRSGEINVDTATLTATPLP